MKKIFTLAAAVLASVAMMAAYAPTSDEVIILNDVYSASATDAGYSTHEAIAWGGTTSTNSKKAGDPANDGAATSSNVPCFSVKGNGSGKNITLNITSCSQIIIYHEKQSSRYVELRADSKTGDLLGKSAGNTYFTAVDLDANTDYSIFLHGVNNKGGDQDFYIYAVKLIYGSIVPVTDPVASVEIDGPEDIFVGKTASYTATTDVKANAYKWTVNGEEQEGATSAKFNYTPLAEGSFAIVCLAKNDNNADFVPSTAINLVATIKPAAVQVDVTESTTWDWANAGSPTAEQKATTVPSNAEEFNFADVLIEPAASFNAAALIGIAQFANRGEYFQGNQISFKTTVAGSVVVTYSNTGGDRPYRHVELNGTLSAEGSADQTMKETEAFNVPAGDVVIKFYIPDANSPKARNNDNVGYTMGRISKIVFTANDGGTTGIDNTTAEVKTVKRVINGQLFIEKAGVLYNAQGAVVK
jgi:hypothetical protein